MLFLYGLPVTRDVSVKYFIFEYFKSFSSHDASQYETESPTLGLREMLTDFRRVCPSVCLSVTRLKSATARAVYAGLFSAAFLKLL